MINVGEEIRIQRSSGPTSLFLHIPYLNYVFFFFQARGAYNIIKNIYLQQRQLPGFFRSAWLTLKFSVLSTIASTVLYSILLALGYNPFGKVLAKYIYYFGGVFGGLLPVNHLALLFGEVPASLLFPTFGKETFISLVAITFATYFIFGMAGALLANFNIRSDLRRAQYF
ncbi:MAG: hypothetical protein NZL89_01485 [Leptospiraceae bacterium]|nr:hypothetical protein [Leptospiraceae bacterium]